MQRYAVAFGIFKVRNKSVFADFHPRHQRLAAGIADRFERGIDFVDVKVDKRAIVGGLVAIALNQRTGCACAAHFRFGDFNA